MRFHSAIWSSTFLTTLSISRHFFADTEGVTARVLVILSGSFMSQIETGLTFLWPHPSRESNILINAPSSFQQQTWWFTSVEINITHLSDYNGHQLLTVPQEDKTAWPDLMTCPLNPTAFVTVTSWLRDNVTQLWVVTATQWTVYQTSKCGCHELAVGRSCTVLDLGHE